MQRKLRLLTWNDSPKSVTGFGVVAKNILGRIYNTGRFEIACVGINHFDEHPSRAFEGLEGIPYKVFIGQDLQASDPNNIRILDRMGRGKVVSFIKRGGFDGLFLMRDLWDMVVPGNNFETFLPLHIQLAKEAGHNFRVMTHFPMEYQLQPPWRAILDQMDYGYCFTAGGMPQLAPWEDNISWCPQGADHTIFRKLQDGTQDWGKVQNQAGFRKHIMRLTEEDNFLILNVNRNQPRKDIEASIVAFKEFLQRVGPVTKRRPILWLHMRPDDNFGDARKLVEKHGLRVDHDVHFPMYFNVATGWTDVELNMLYNAADVFMTTSVIEGFGLTPVEAGMAGCPILVPNHTGFLQTACHLGMPYVDVKAQEMRPNIGPSAIYPTNTDDLANKLFDHYQQPDNLFFAVEKHRVSFTKRFSWDNIFNKYWEPLLETLEEDVLNTQARQTKNKDRIFYVCEEAAGDILGATKAIAGIKQKHPNIPIDKKKKKKFEDIVAGNPNISQTIPWDINKIFDYPKERLVYPHAKIRHGSWSNGFSHLLNMQSEMVGVQPGEVFVYPEEFDLLIDDMNGEVAPYITINTSSQGGKMISVKQWQELIGGIISNVPEIRFVLVGGPGDMQVPGAINRLGTSFREMAHIQKDAICHIGIDSGPGHFADAVGTPSIIFWGWTNVNVCRPEKYSINISAHYPSCCPRLGPCHGVSPACGVNQYDRDSSMKAPCLQSIVVSPAVELVNSALIKAKESGNIMNAKDYLKDVAERNGAAVIFSNVKPLLQINPASEALP